MKILATLIPQKLRCVFAKFSYLDTTNLVSLKSTATEKHTERLNKN